MSLMMIVQISMRFFTKKFLVSLHCRVVFFFKLISIS